MNIILYIHIFAGVLSFGAGYLALFSKKGHKRHTKAGSVFLYSMLTVALSAIVLSIKGQVHFLTFIAVFSLYQVVSGKRAIMLKNSKGHPLDWALSFAGIINGILMIVQLNVVLIVFGIIQLAIALQDLRFFYHISIGKNINPKAWLARHIGLMMGALIASTTAFLVVNVQIVQAYWVPWLLPTVLLIPVIAWYTRKFTALARGKI